MRALIVDDEAPARDRMKRLLEVHPEIKVVGEASHGLEALQQIDALDPDLVFLDIEMPELDGISVANCIRHNGPRVVFVTAYDAHAVKAFEVAAVDYLVKPVAESRLRQTIDKLLQLSAPQNLQHFLATAVKKRVAVRCGAKFMVIDSSQLSAVVAKDRYSALFVEGREILSEESLETWAQRLCRSQFVRIHRGALVNFDYVKELRREGDRKYTAVLNDAKGTQLAISRERLDEVKARLSLA